MMAESMSIATILRRVILLLHFLYQYLLLLEVLGYLVSGSRLAKQYLLWVPSHGVSLKSNIC